MNSHRPKSWITSKEPALNNEKESRRTWPRCHVSLEKSSKNHKPLEKWAKPNLIPSVPPRPANSDGEYFQRVFHVVIPDPPKLSAVLTHHSRWQKSGERAGWFAVWYSSVTGWEKSAQFKLKMASDVLLLSYLDKIGLSLTDEAGQASAYLYSDARLYKRANLALLSQSATTHSTGNISVGVKKVGHSNTRGTSEFFVLSRSKYLLHLVYIFNILWRLKVKVSRHLQ
jgi:hypothetical protein